MPNVAFGGISKESGRFSEILPPMHCCAELSRLRMVATVGQLFPLFFRSGFSAATWL